MRLLSLPLAALAVVSALSAQAPVRVWQGALEVPVYDEGLPDENPPFDIFASVFFNYPYTLRNSLTGHKQERHLRALYLENEYLKCSVLPDLGGHLYSCTDKLSGREMFYANPSIKPQLIGYRGAWAAFGIEFNFPVSHNWMSLSPVDFAWHANADGSASIIVANIDRPYGMQWTIEMILRPGSTVLEDKVTLYNRSDVRHRYYWWTNAGVEITNDSQIAYPMRYTASHGFTYVDTWPVNHEGKDLSVIRNHTSGPVSEFVYGSREPFMGVWHPATGTGLVHYAPYAELPGKKIWSWGVDPDGLEWRRALSDNNSGYVEVQGGLYRNQETYAFLPPQETLCFSEYWMPARGIGGITRANLEGVVHLWRENGRLIARLNPNRRIAGAATRLRCGDRVVAERKLDLDPAAPFSLEAANAPDGKCTFELSAGGSVLLAHTEDTWDWTPAADIKAGPQEPVRPTGDMLEKGTDQELNGVLLGAATTYREALNTDPGNFELNKAAGRLAATLRNYPEAIRLLSRAQYRRSNDPEIHYYLGQAFLGAGDVYKARTEFEAAQRQPYLRAAARLMLARISGRSGDPSGALDWVRAALAEKPDAARAGGMEVALLRSLRRQAEARQRLERWLAANPADSFLRVEGVKLGGDDEPLWRHLAADPERVIEIATGYMDLGLYQDAVEILSRRFAPVGPLESEPGTELPQDYPLVTYYRAYCRRKLNTADEGDFEMASKQSTRYVFPSRPLTAAVLRAAIEHNAGDATAHFLLGSWYLAGGMVDSAVGEWNAARGLNSGIPVLHRNLGKVLLLVRHDDAGALQVFREGLTADPRNAELYTGMTQALSILRRPPEDRLKVLESYTDRDHEPTPLAWDTALTLAETGQFERARKMFEGRYFERQEGGTTAREIYVEIQLQEALALAKAGKRQEAKAHMPDLGEISLAGPRSQFYLAKLESLLGDQQAAERRWRRVTEGRGAYAILAAQSLNEAGWRDRAVQALDAVADDGYQGGLILLALGRKAEAEASLAACLRQPDRRLSHYIARRALLGE